MLYLLYQNFILKTTASVVRSWVSFKLCKMGLFHFVWKSLKEETLKDKYKKLLEMVQFSILYSEATELRKMFKPKRSHDVITMMSQDLEEQWVTMDV